MRLDTNPVMRVAAEYGIMGRGGLRAGRAASHVR